MAYATLSDVQAKLPNITFGDPVYDTLKPTEAQVTAWLGEVSDNVLDPVVRTLVTTMPITNTYALAYLETMAVNWVCAQVLRSLDRDAEAVAMYRADFDEAMKLLLKRPTILEAPAGGAKPTHHDVRDYAPFTRNYDSTEEDDKLW